MTSIFDALDAAVSAAVQKTFSEVAVLRPRVSAQYVERAVDPDRPQAILHGVFSAGPAETDLRGQGKGAEFSGVTRASSASAEFWIAKAEVDALAALPAKGDTITLTDRAGCPVYAVARVQPTDRGDLNLILVREDQSE